MVTDTDVSLHYFQAELSRIDILIGREVARWQRAGQDPHDGFRGLYLAEGEMAQLLARPFGASWGRTVALSPEEESAFARAEAAAREQVRALSESARKRGQVPRLEALATAFGLDRFDLDTLLICLAPALDLRYERIYAFLQDDVTRKRPTVNLVLDLLSNGQPEHRLALLQRFHDDAPLFKHRFLARLPDTTAEATPLLGQALGVDPGLVTWLLGAYQPHADLRGHAVMWEPRPEADVADAVLAGEIWPELERATEQKCPLCVFYGVDNAAQRAAARLLAWQAGRPLLSIDLAGVVSQGVAPVDAVELALRDARLTGAIPNLTGWDVCLVDGGSQQAESAPGAAVVGSSPPSALLAELCAYPDLLVVAGRVRWQAGGIDRDRLLAWLEFPTPAYGQREALWEHYLGGEAVDAQDVMALAGQFALTTGQIRDAVASARDGAAQRGEALQSYDLLAAARAHSNPRLSSLARKITPRFTWDDIVLPMDQIQLLHEIVATVRQRPLVLEVWGVGRKLASSAGVTMLFSGEPGTGKTMAAEVMANELGLDLYKIDLSTVVSKYIGETEKNLERIFGEAQSSNAILFFDEADAIFGKRSEVKDAH
ncbi:MAG: ATP-binding protein, partial [Anaerolineae bacterium]|nr:ATP-binding protein [Anaerolineae bacterium]